MKTKQLLVGIAGPKRSGKDTFAIQVGRHLLEQKLATIRRRSFADALKQEVAEFVGMQITPSPRSHLFVSRNIATVMDALYSDQATVKEPYRLLMQWWGTEFRRVWFGEEYWVRQLAAYLATEVAQPTGPLPVVILIPDVRFPNEAAFIKEQGGLLVQMVRPHLPVDTHPSEVALAAYDGYDFIAHNGASLLALDGQVRRFMAECVCPALDR